MFCFVSFAKCLLIENLNQKKSSQLLATGAASQVAGNIGGRRSISEKISVMGHSSAKYGGRYMVTALPGDGIGPEMVDHVRNLFK